MKANYGPKEHQTITIGMSLCEARIVHRLMISVVEGSELPQGDDEVARFFIVSLGDMLENFK